MCTKSTPPASSAMSTKVARSLRKYSHSKYSLSKYSRSKCDADEGGARSLHLAKRGCREGPAPHRQGEPLGSSGSCGCLLLLVLTTTVVSSRLVSLSPRAAHGELPRVAPWGGGRTSKEWVVKGGRRV
eukprot:scaffold113276_cov69-Phaeocystis_antarctica.AAC.6